MSDPVPPPDSFPLAEQARAARLWEEAIRFYRQALTEGSPMYPIHMGLGKAYEGKSREAGSTSFLLLAMDQYRHALRLEPASDAAHDALLAAAASAGKLEELLEEYRFRLAKDPALDSIRAALRKMEALYAMRGTYVPPAAGPGPLTTVLMTVVVPLAAFSCLLAALFLSRVFSAFSQPLQLVFLNSGFFLLLLYVVYWVFVFFMKKRG